MYTTMYTIIDSEQTTAVRALRTRCSFHLRSNYKSKTRFFFHVGKRPRPDHKTPLPIEKRKNGYILYISYKRRKDKTEYHLYFLH